MEECYEMVISNGGIQNKVGLPYLSSRNSVWLECHIVNVEVVGSNPVVRTLLRGIQNVRGLDAVGKA